MALSGKIWNEELNVFERNWEFLECLSIFGRVGKVLIDVECNIFGLKAVNYHEIFDSFACWLWTVNYNFYVFQMLCDNFSILPTLWTLPTPKNPKHSTNIVSISGKTS